MITIYAVLVLAIVALFATAAYLDQRSKRRDAEGDLLTARAHADMLYSQIPSPRAEQLADFKYGGSE